MSDSTNDQASFLDTAKSAAGVLGGHAQLANGAAQEQIGNLLDSESWKQSGIETKGSAGENIKQAFSDFKAQSGEDSKASQVADSACPQTGDGVGDNPNS